MEIHAPEESARTWKDILLHLAIVTVGILIAIALDELVEWRHHRELAEEARQNIRAELSDNRNRVAALIKELPKIADEQAQTARTLKMVLKNRPKQTPKMGLHWTSGLLLDSSWTTAQSVGALAYMKYAEVKEYAAVYQLQAMVVANGLKIQEGTSTSVGALATQSVEKISDAELVNTIDRIEQLSGYTYEQEQIGASLVKAYDEVLASNP